MKFETITIKDIAKALGLSTSTVSRALRGGYEISEETKKIVLDYAKKINYKPNPIALSLKERRSHSIGVVVCEIANSFFSQAINGIESIAYGAGYHVIITQSNESYEREIINVQHLASRSVDGLLISLSAGSSDISYLKELHAKGLPIVFFDRVSSEIQTHKVIANNIKGAHEATEYLINLGHKRIAHFTNAAHLSITKERLEGYKGALQKHGLPFEEKHVKYSEYGGMRKEEVDQLVKELLDLPERPDAIFIAQDRLSTGFLKSVKRADPDYARNITIAGFTNSNVVDLFSPSITAVRQPAFEIGQAATQLLIQLIESKYPVTEFETKVLDTELIVK
ncbi:LacI family DNA-binding transcriptional regulator [Pedobacter sp. SYSU D00535]|uniref:LacI family DNA-binding transcriptional regulator n=1 Tax=Pedobacter sp. SYSU D00535 TaxID=2810308 RepID=UPI001A974222|nr:LacI family DNA-binding transcriptional regulator [Pedobacter sp. SYSU D00535]